MSKRTHKPKVTEAELSRVTKLLQGLGCKVAAVDTFPSGKVRIITTEGAGLTLGDEEENLDRELQQHRGSRGYGTA